MDPGRLPAYRSSYLLRFHPYPRMKAPVRERIVTLVQEPLLYEPLPDILVLESDTSFTLNQAIHGTGTDDEIQLRQRRLSMSALVVDLALLFKKLSVR